MALPKRSKIEWALWIIALACMLINLVYVFKTEQSPRWVKLANVAGWILLLSLTLRDYQKKKKS